MGWIVTILTLENWICLGLMVAAMAALGMLWRQERRHAAERLRERARRKELEAYTKLDPRLSPDGGPRELAMRVCRTVSQNSLFTRAAMLVEDAERRLYVAGSAGFDDVAIAALNQWGAEAVRSGKRKPEDKSFNVMLRPPQQVLAEIENGGDRVWQVVMVPIETQAGHMAGVLAVCSDLVQEGMLESLASLEMLAVKLGRTMENRQLMERLLRAEKMAGLGQLAGGVAHELNNPLTAVLGYAELIAETSTEARVRQDAQTIAREALRMRNTVENLQNFWRPSPQAEEPVQMGVMMLELAGAYADKLARQGVRLMIQAGNDLPPVRGDRAGLRAVLEHLLDNAAQAIAAARADAGPGNPEEHAIRVTVSHDQRTLQVVVSDTGAGFLEPGRVFDPFYTTRQPGEGTGMGLALSYGIVREHGGEISAYNLEPHGAAVMVELPLRKLSTGDSGATRVAVQA